jgi:DNA-binding XRE family transcriptional regulator
MARFFAERSALMASTETDPLSFGSLLKASRQHRRLTQQHLATALGVQRRTIMRWEQGEILPDNKAIVQQLARQLHLDGLDACQFLEASLTAPAPYWCVPLQRNALFTGRQEVMNALHTHLSTNRIVALTQAYALQGPGGIGKTQIALEYAYRHVLKYSAVFWITAETDEQITTSLLRIAETLQVPGSADREQQRVVALVQRWLLTHDGWLLIWDNVEELAGLERFLSSLRSGTILLTTRSQVLGTLAWGLDLLPMEQKEGIAFLLRRANLLNPDPQAPDEQLRLFATHAPAQYAAAAELVAAMGGLPLALDQAGAYLEATQCGLPAYLDLFGTRRLGLLEQRGEQSHGHPASVSTTFSLAATATTRRHPAVEDLLRVCALVQPDAIPEELFCQGGEQLGVTLAAAVDDPGAPHWGARSRGARGTGPGLAPHNDPAPPRGPAWTC